MSYESGLCSYPVHSINLSPEQRNKIIHENVNIVKLPCYVGDVIKYTDEYNSFEFVVEKIVIDSKETCIYGLGIGCVIYLRNFNKYCENITEKERVKDREYHNGEY
mgnify:CR=1 FL=1